MYIFQIADLHIGSSEKCSGDEETILSRAVEKIKQDIPGNQKVLISVCGDIIDSKNISKRQKQIVNSRYEEAAGILSNMVHEMKEKYEVRIQFCLGNHDTTHIDEFSNFVQKFNPELTKEKIEDGYFMEWDGVYYIFLNSCKDRQYEFGCIDYGKVKRMLEELPLIAPKIFVLHHTVISMYANDKSSIRDSAALLKLIETYNVIGVLHGHIHGKEQLLVGKKRCRILGTGALFSRNNSDVNSQFNIIEMESYIFREISTYIYRADDRISGNSWYKISSEENYNENYFQGNSFQDVHEELMSRLANKPVLNNVVLQINSPYEAFKTDLKKYLKDDELVIGQKSFSYDELAELWESLEVPQNLYFNHGMYFKVKDKDKDDNVGEHGIFFIAQQLKDKPTSNRAVLTTYGMDMIAKMLKGEEYLPSLLAIQFGRSSNGDTIFVHMYLRALEAGRFLKINICEIEWLLEQLKKQNVIFNKVEIAISAFRVREKKKFNCFLKADIDKISQMELYSLVCEGEIIEICRMLEEKMDASETITNVDGLKNLCEALKIAGEREKSYKYSATVIEKLDDILVLYGKLDEIHRRGSITTEEETQYEGKICRGIEDVICELRGKENNKDNDIA